MSRTWSCAQIDTIKKQLHTFAKHYNFFGSLRAPTSNGYQKLRKVNRNLIKMHAAANAGYKRGAKRHFLTEPAS